MNYLQRSIAGLAIFAISCLAHSAPIIANLEDATNGGGFFGQVTFADNGADTVTITADIAAPINTGLTQGDILGLWFDIANFGALGGFIGVTSPPVLSGALLEDAVNSLGGNININGSGAVGWDLGVQVGENGIAGGFVQTLSFDLSITGLDQTQFLNQRVGMRVQSIAGGSFTGGSSKLLGSGGNIPEPGSLALLGIGLLGFALARRRRYQ